VAEPSAGSVSERNSWFNPLTLGLSGLSGLLVPIAPPLVRIFTTMSTLARWWQHPLVLGLASLAIALAVAFLPLGIDTLRARKRAAPIEVLASPGTVSDSTGSPTTTTRARAK